MITRRRFMQSAAATGAYTLMPWPLRAALAAPASVLSGTEFQLEIGAAPLTINGRQATATGVNGQVPAPILRWREGDTLTLTVTNRLSEPSSIPLARHPHAFAHGRCAGAQLPRHRVNVARQSG